MKKIIYQPADITKAQRAALEKDGYTVVDSRFAPAGYNAPSVTELAEPAKLTKQKIKRK